MIKNNIQLSSKGNMRKKKIIRKQKKKNIESDISLKLDNLIDEINLLYKNENPNDIFLKYIDIFSIETITNIKKNNKKSKNETLLNIKKKLYNSFRIFPLKQDINNYINNNLLDSGIIIINEFLEVIINILNNKEYLNYKYKSISEYSDIQMKQAFDKLDIDYSKKSDAFQIRNIFNDKFKNNKPDFAKLDDDNIESLYILLNIIKNTYKNINFINYE